MGYYNDLSLSDTHTTDDEWYDRAEGSGGLAGYRGGALVNPLARVQYVAAPLVYIIKIYFDFGTRYVRYAELPDGTWLTSRFVEAKEWKTRRGAECWLAHHPELQAIATVDFV